MGFVFHDSFPHSRRPPAASDRHDGKPASPHAQRRGAHVDAPLSPPPLFSPLTCQQRAVPVERHAARGGGRGRGLHHLLYALGQGGRVGRGWGGGKEGRGGEGGGLGPCVACAPRPPPPSLSLHSPHTHGPASWWARPRARGPRTHTHKLDARKKEGWSSEFGRSLTFSRPNPLRSSFDRRRPLPPSHTRARPTHGERVWPDRVRGQVRVGGGGGKSERGAQIAGAASPPPAACPPHHSPFSYLSRRGLSISWLARGEGAVSGQARVCPPPAFCFKPCHPTPPALFTPPGASLCGPTLARWV